MRVTTTKVYLDWINSLKDRASRARIQVRVDRLVHGNPGQHRVLTDGVCELKVDFGPDIASITRSERALSLFSLQEATSHPSKRTLGAVLWPKQYLRKQRR